MFTKRQKTKWETKQSLIGRLHIVKMTIVFSVDQCNGTPKKSQDFLKLDKNYYKKLYK